MAKTNTPIAVLFAALCAAGMLYHTATHAAAYRDGFDYQAYPMYADSRDQQWQERRQMSREDREQLKRKREYYESLPPEEQEKIRHARERYQKMSPEQKQQLRKRWEQMSPDERKQYRKWRKEQKNDR